VVSELWFNVPNIIFNAASSALAILIMVKFKGSRQVLPWGLIALGFATIAVGSILLSQINSMGAEADYIDWFLVGGLLLIGVGLISYWLILKLNFKKMPGVSLSLIIAFSAGFALLNYIQLGSLSGAFLTGSTMLALIAVIPITTLFKGGKIAWQWVFVFLGLLVLILNEVTLISGGVAPSITNLSNINLVMSSFLMMFGLMRLQWF